MLVHTFCHLPGVGEKTERNLWERGVTTWEVFFERHRLGTTGLRGAWHALLEESLRHHAVRDARYFADRLRSAQGWRLFRDFRDECAFLDIETTGLAWTDRVTTIALYDGRQVRHYVRGRNLDAFADDVRAYRLLVTYNGTCFDLPFLERSLGLRFPQAHVDLRYVLRALGLKGGLKGCERHLGLARPDLEGVDGFTAVLLWHEYERRGDERALETLLAYNIQDVLSLEILLVHAHNTRIRQTPFADTHALEPGSPPAVPFRADPDTVARVVGRQRGAWPGQAAVPTRSLF